MNPESWQPIPGYTRYEVSNLGRVRSLKRQPFRELKQILNGRYYKVSLSESGRIKQWTIHTLVLSAFVGPRPAGMECCHTDGNPLNNRLENLRWDTPENNAADRERHGRTNRGRFYGNQYT